MNFKQKLGYMCIGCLFTITGYILASLSGIITPVQKDEQVFDKIVCKQLEVVNEEKKPVAIIGVTEDGNGNGFIAVLNAAGKLGARIRVTEDGNGFIETYKGGWRSH